MYKALLLIFLSIILSSCFKDSNIDTKQWGNLRGQEKINSWVENESINWWWWWIPSNQVLKR